MIEKTCDYLFLLVPQVVQDYVKPDKSGRGSRLGYCSFGWWFKIQCVYVRLLKNVPNSVTYLVGGSFNYNLILVTVTQTLKDFAAFFSSFAYPYPNKAIFWNKHHVLRSHLFEITASESVKPIC